MHLSPLFVHLYVTLHSLYSQFLVYERNDASIVERKQHAKLIYAVLEIETHGG